MLTLYIDDRETWIREYLDILPFNFKFERLDVSDFIIKNDDEIILTIERKTIKDLYSSIIDKRYIEQMNRMNNDISLYIIENSNGDFFKNDTKKFNIVNGCLLNLLFKHKFKIYTTFGKFHTIEVLKMLMKKFENNDFEKNNTEFKCISKVKYNSENIMIRQLMCINGVSQIIATKIYEKYKTLENLIKQLNDAECLIGLEINKDRKIGKSLSEKIYKSLTQ